MNPSRLFVQQQLMDWREDKEDAKVCLIHDNDPVFNMPHYFDAYGIKDVPISVNAPNMNCYIERFVRSIRREALDWFIIIS